MTPRLEKRHPNYKRAVSRTKPKETSNPKRSPEDTNNSFRVEAERSSDAETNAWVGTMRIMLTAPRPQPHNGFGDDDHDATRCCGGGWSVQIYWGLLKSMFCLLLICFAASRSKAQDANSRGRVCKTRWIPSTSQSTGQALNISSGGSSSNSTDLTARPSYRCCTGWNWNGQDCVVAGFECTECYPCIGGDICDCAGGGRAPICEAATVLCDEASGIGFDRGLFPAFNIVYDHSDWLLAGKKEVERDLDIMDSNPYTPDEQQVAVFDSLLSQVSSNGKSNARLLTVLYMQPAQGCHMSLSVLVACRQPGQQNADMMMMMGSSNSNSNDGRTASQAGAPIAPGYFQVRVVSGHSEEELLYIEAAHPCDGRQQAEWAVVELPINVSTTFQVEFEAYSSESSGLLVALDNITFTEDCCSVDGAVSLAPPPDQMHTPAMPSQAPGLPDVHVDARMLRDSLYVDTRDLTREQILCSISEDCLAPSVHNNTDGPAGVESRSLLRFTTAVWNTGKGDFSSPPGHIPIFHQCHHHFHSFSEFATYSMIDERGAEQGHGHKASFCLLDSICRNGTQPKHIICTETLQSISPGCADVYGADLDCQWVDISNFAVGCYQLTVHVNPSRVIQELDYSNNNASVAFFFNGVNVNITEACQELFAGKRSLPEPSSEASSTSTITSNITSLAMTDGGPANQAISPAIGEQPNATGNAQDENPVVVRPWRSLAATMRPGPSSYLTVLFCVAVGRLAVYVGT
eukprot:scpid57072/ scgid19369/ Lysyl oxidase homolog 4; Lysyl oxidase-like protein 4; Lysyl oxidase-related protein C